MRRWLAFEQLSVEGVGGKVELGVYGDAPLELTRISMCRDDAEQLACALLQAAGWDTAAMLAGPGGRAPVFVGELRERGERVVKP